MEELKRPEVMDTLLRFCEQFCTIQWTRTLHSPPMGQDPKIPSYGTKPSPDDSRAGRGVEEVKGQDVVNAHGFKLREFRKTAHGSDSALNSNPNN